MKQLATIFTILLLFIIGCSDHTSITSPEQSVQKQEPNWITLPNDPALSVEKQYSTSGWIYKNTDSEFIIDKSRPGGFRGEIKTNVKLKFYKHSVSKNSFVTLTADDVSTCCTFGPSQNFLKPGYLYVKYEGIDLTGVNPEEIIFVYMDANGVYVEIQYGEVKVDLQSGTLELIDGIIPHFSRYGFVRKSSKY